MLIVSLHGQLCCSLLIIGNRMCLCQTGGYGAMWFARLHFIILALTYYKQVHADYQQEKENQRQALAAMNRDKEKLFSIIAHDIRGPLATLELLLEMFQKGEYGESDMREAAIELRIKSRTTRRTHLITFYDGVQGK